MRVILSDGASWPHPEWLRAQGDLDGALTLIDHIASHPTDTAGIVKQVREYRRALKAKGSRV